MVRVPAAPFQMQLPANVPGREADAPGAKISV